MNQISRHHVDLRTAQLSLATTLAATPEIPVEEFASGTIFIPTGSSITSLTYYAARRQGSSQLAGGEGAATFLPLNSQAATPVAITQTVAGGNAYDMPSACFGAGAIKIVVNVAGTVEVSLKG